MCPLTDRTFTKAKCINNARMDREYMNIKSMEDQKISPKPIFTIGLPSTLGGSFIGKEAIDGISKMISEKFQDYNVLVHTQTTTSDPVFQAFYPKDFDEVAFEELKSQVLNIVNP